jgi:hypothetical protein
VTQPRCGADLSLGDPQRIARTELLPPPAPSPLPLVGRFSHLLPLLDLGGGHFEPFGLEAVEKLDGLAGGRIYGRSGQTQHGIDVYGRRADGGTGVYQMRCRGERLTAAKLRKAVKDYFDGPQPFAATWFELCWAGRVDDVAIDNELDDLRAAYPDRRISLRDQTRFTTDLMPHRDLVLRWFGEHTANAVYGAHAQAPTLAAAIDTDTLLRGPLEALYLAGDRDAAELLRESDPARAAEMFDQLAQRLRAEGYFEHADELRSERLEALLAAGQVELAYREALTALEHHVDRGGESRIHPDFRTMLAARAALTGGAFPEPLPRLSSRPAPAAPGEPWPAGHPQVQRSVALLGNDAARGEPAEPLTFAIDATGSLVAAEDGMNHAAVTALRRLAETALLNEDREALERVRDMAGQLLPRLGPPADRDDEDDRVRVRLALADATGEQGTVGAEARSGSIPSRLAGLVHARRARWLTWNAHPSEAHAEWLEAVRAAGLAGLHEDARDFLWALHQLHGSYRSGVSLDSIEYARRARAVPPEGRALFAGSDVEMNALRQLRAFERASQRFRPSDEVVRRMLRQQLLEATVRADLLGELEAHRMLADLHAAADEPSETLYHSIRCGDVESAAMAAQQLGSTAAHCLDDPPVAPWAMKAALAAYDAIGDLVTQDQLRSHLPWILTRLQAHPASGWTDNDIRDRAMSALESVAYQLSPDDFANIQEALAPYLNLQVWQSTMHAAVRTAAHMFRSAPDHAVPRTILLDVVRTLPDHAATEMLGAGRALRALSAYLEAQADNPDAAARSGAVELLARLQVPHPAVIEEARRLAQEVLATSTGVATVEVHIEGGRSHEPAGIYGRLLPNGERAQLAQKLVEIAEDGSTVEYDRAHAVHAIRHLAPAIDAAQRRQTFDRVWTFVGGLRQNDLHVRILAGGLRPAVIRAAGQLAVTEEQCDAVRTVAVARLVDDNDAAGIQALIDTRSENDVDLDLLAHHEQSVARQAAAVLWSRNPSDPTLGGVLAADADQQVRTRVAECLRMLGERNTNLRGELRQQLRIDPSAQVRRAVRESDSE